MAARTLTNAQILWNQFDVSGYTGTFDTGITTAMEGTNNFAGGGYSAGIPGLQSSMLAITGQQGYATGEAHGVFSGAVRGRQDIVAAITPASGAAVAGDQAIFTRGQLDKFQGPTGAVGSVASFSASIVGDTAEVVGVVGAPLASRTTAGLTGTSLQLGAVATGTTGVAQRLWAALFVTATTGTNLAVTIQSDNATGFPSAATALTFTTVSAVGAQYSSVAGPITDDWFRVVATIGTGTFTFAVVLGVF